MNTIATFIITKIPPPKKNMYRIGKGRMWHDRKVKAQILACTEEVKSQWVGHDSILDNVHVHAVINKKKKYPDDINILETVYDCLESAGVVKNDNQITSWSGKSITDKLSDEKITIQLRSL